MLNDPFEGGTDDGFVKMATVCFIGVITESDMEVEVGFVIHQGDITDEGSDFMITDDGL